MASCVSGACESLGLTGFRFIVRRKAGEKAVAFKSYIASGPVQRMRGLRV